MKSAVHSFHLPLPGKLYEGLMAEARRGGRPATAVARQIIGDGLRALRRQRLARKIAEYARQNAGTSADLDTRLEVAAIEALRSTQETSPFDPAAYGE